MSFLARVMSGSGWLGGSGAVRLYPFVAFALTVLAAWLSYRYVETPMLALKDKRFLFAPATGA